MKIQKNITLAAAIAAVCLAAYSASAKADYIGCKFVANAMVGYTEITVPGGVIGDWHTNVDALAPTETAGVPPLCVQANWNNLGRLGTNVTLNDSNGTPTSVNISWYSYGMWYSTTSKSLTNDTKLMDGFLEGTWTYDQVNVAFTPGTSLFAMPNPDQPTIFLTGLGSFLSAQNGGTYSIIIYADTDGTGQGRIGQYFVDVASGTYDSITDLGAAIETDTDNIPPTSAPAPVFFDAETTQFNGSNYTMVPLTAIGNANNAAFGNYIEFDGLTNDTILLRTQTDGSHPSTPINAIQIIALGGQIPASPSTPVASPTNTVFGGSPVTLSVTVKGNRPITYQWQTLDNDTGAYTNIPSISTNYLSLIMPDTGSTYTNQYIMVCTNIYSYPDYPYQAATSAVCSITVYPASNPLLTKDINIYSTNVYGFIGGKVNFNANFGLGTMPITNWWLLKPDSGGGYAPVAGAGTNAWTLTNVLSSGFYELAATNAIGSSNSTPAHLTALADPGAPPSNGATNMYSYCVYTNHPWAYWKFEETNDTIKSSMQAYDYSGHNFDATYGNSDGTANSGCKDGGESIKAGQYGPGNNNDGYSGFPVNDGCATMAYNFDNGCLTVPPLNLNTNNNVTFTMWIYINPANPQTILPSEGLFMNRNGNDGAGINFGSAVSTNINGISDISIAELSYVWNSNATTGWHSGLYPCPGTWNFVACVITPSSTTMYLYYANPGSYGSTNLYKAVRSGVTNNPEAFSGGTTWIGGDNWNNSYTFNGSIDEVAVFTNAMSESQIQGLFLRSVGLTNGVAPNILTQPPSSVSIYTGQPLQLSVLDGGIPNPTNQWLCSVDGVTWMIITNANASGTNSPNLVVNNFPPNKWPAGATNFEVIVGNGVGNNVTSKKTIVTAYPTIPNYNNGTWVMNFAIATTNQSGTGNPFTGRGVLGATSDSYWNALNAYSGQAINVTAYRDDGTANPATTNVMFSSQAGDTVGSGSSLWTGVTNNMLLDTYIIVDSTPTNPTPFVFSNIPNGRYNLALYGCVASWLNRAIQFTVLTNGVSAGTAAMTNLQDFIFAPNDNTAVFTNLLVMNGRLEVDIAALPCPLNTNSTECEFNGAQLELVKYGPTFNSTNIGGNTVLNWSYGMLLQATNVFGPWTTNVATTASGSYTINPTGYIRFFRVYDPTNI